MREREIGCATVLAPHAQLFKNYFRDKVVAQLTKLMPDTTPESTMFKWLGKSQIIFDM